MLNPDLLKEVAGSFAKTFGFLARIEEELKRRFTRDLWDAIEGLVLSVASGESLLLVGKPGTGKSRLIRDFCQLIGLVDENGDAITLTDDKVGYFEYLLTPFTEPGELFGFYDINALLDKEGLSRLDEGMMQKAKVIYLDEVFNGSSAILNSLLSFLNERRLHEGGSRVKVAMQCLFGATNNVPDAPELKAVFDRFLLRCTVENCQIDSKDGRGELELKKLMQKGWWETYAPPDQKRLVSGTDFLDNLDRFQEYMSRKTRAEAEMKDSNFSEDFLGRSHDFYKKLTHLIATAREYELSDMSNRRVIKMLYVMTVHRIYEAIKKKEFQEPGAIRLGPPQLELFPKFFLDREENEIIEIHMRSTIGNK
jgi:MoxR-like ATPase